MRFDGSAGRGLGADCFEGNCVPAAAGKVAAGKVAAGKVRAGEAKSRSERFHRIPAARSSASRRTGGDPASLKMLASENLVSMVE